MQKEVKNISDVGEIQAKRLSKKKKHWRWKYLP